MPRRTPNDRASADAPTTNEQRLELTADDVTRLAASSLDADFLRTIIEESNRCFFLIDPELQCVVYASPAFERVWGIPQNSFYHDNTRWMSTIHPDDREFCRRQIEIRLQSLEERHGPIDNRILHPDGSERWIRGSMFQCRDSSSQRKLLCGMAEDITDLKRHEAERAAAHVALEETVAERTQQLKDVNEALREEIRRRVGIENEIREKQAFLERLLRFQEWDRRLMSHELHDGAVKNVIGAMFHLDAAAADSLSVVQRAKIQQCRELLEDAMREARRIINGMRPQTLDDLGLQAALEENAEYNGHQGLTVDLQFNFKFERRCPMIETTVYRLVQEALNNVRRHSGANHARVEVRLESNHLLLTIADEGCGFEPAKCEGFGLKGMHERASAVGGVLQITSRPGCGTTVTARLPRLDPGESAAIERDLAEAALITGRLRNQAILDEAAAVVFVKDAQGRYELINRRHEQLFHVTREELIGKTDFDFLPPEVAERVRANDQEVLKRNCSITFEESVPSNGEMRDYVTVKFPLPADNGGLPSICGIATDITKQKRQMRTIEAQLQTIAEQQRRFEAFMEHSPILAWIKNAAGVYVFVNRQILSVHGFEPDQMLGRTDAEIFPPDVAAELREHDLEVLRTGEAHRFREVCPAGNGPPLVWESCKFRLKADDGSYLVGGVALDVTHSAVRFDSFVEER